MSKYDALEISDRLFCLKWPLLVEAASVLRQQHAEIEMMKSVLSEMVVTYESPEKCSEALKMMKESHASAWRAAHDRSAECGSLSFDLMVAKDEIERLRRQCARIYGLLARIHRDGGQYTVEHGIEKSCDDAESRVVTWLETIGNVDALIEQARIAEREACAMVCEKSSFPAFTAKCFAADIRARAKP